MARILSQNYPRIDDAQSKWHACIDISKLESHTRSISNDELKAIIEEAIEYAETKTSQYLYTLPHSVSKREKVEFLKKEGAKLLLYFRKYCSDPAQTALSTIDRHYKDVALELGQNRHLQKLRMHSGWRYQFIARDTANKTGRFVQISDIGTEEADFNASVRVRQSKEIVSIYVSVKNRSNTMGGQDWPKAIAALEQVAIGDKNRKGPYLCVFGMAMERGTRNIKTKKKTDVPYSYNTEIWMSDFFWPFFSNFSYEEIAKTVLDVLIKHEERKRSRLQVLPKELLEGFGEACNSQGLLNEQGFFDNPHKLVEFFCRK